jgi:hypothetical protein
VLAPKGRRQAQLRGRGIRSKGFGMLASAESRKNRVRRIEVSLEVGSFEDLFGRIERIRWTDRQRDRIPIVGALSQ